MKEFCEFGGRVHLVSPIGGSEHTLCGNANDEPGTEHQPTKARTITCLECATVINYCRGVRVSADASTPDIAEDA